MRPLYGQSVLVAQWVGLRIPYVRRRMEALPAFQAEPFGPASAIGVLDGAGALVAGVVYHNYDPWCRSVEMSFAADTRRWLTRELIGVFIRYPFDELQCQRLTGVTPRKATSARRFLQQFGFKHEGTVRRGFGDDDAIVSGLLRREWEQSRWAQPLVERQKRREAMRHGEEGRNDGHAAGPGGHRPGADAVEH